MTFESASLKRAVPPDEPSTTKGLSEKKYYDDDAFDVTEFGQGGKYLRNKRKKMNKQVQSLLGQSDVQYPQIFTSLRIYINGYTGSNKGLPQFIEMITLHGGLYVPYLDRKSLVTHIVAATLTPSKIEEFRDYKVARPSWLEQSVAQGRLLDWRAFSTVAEAEDTSLGFDDSAGRRGVRSAQQSLFGMAQVSKPPLTRPAPPKLKVKSLKRVELEPSVKIAGGSEPSPKLKVRLPASPERLIEKQETRDRVTGPFPSPPSSGSSQSLKASSVPCITLSDDEEESMPVSVVSKPPRKTGRRSATDAKPSKDERSSSDLDPDEGELRYYDIDPEVFRALPRREQAEALSSARMRKLAPRQTQRQARLQGTRSKPSLDLKPSHKMLKSTLQSLTKRTVHTEEPDPADCSEEEVALLGLDYETLQALPLELRREQIQDRRDWYRRQSSLRITSSRADPVDRQAAINSKLRRVPVRDPVKLRGRVDQDSFRETIEEWLNDAIEQGPDEKDVERIAKFLEKRASRRKGCDLSEVNNILEWWASFLEAESGREAASKGTSKALWSTLRHVQSRVNAHVRNEYGLDL